MSQFYKRYIPPPKANSNPPRPDYSEKRKHEHEAEHEQTIRQEKRRKLVEQDGVEETNVHPKHTETHLSLEKQVNGHGILQKYSISQFAKANSPDIQINVRRPSRQQKPSMIDDTDDTQAEPNASHESSDLVETKHAGVLQRREKSRKRSSARNEDKLDGDTPDSQPGVLPNVMYDLVPLPQPKTQKPTPNVPKFSVRPSWQEEAIKVESSKHKKIKKLGLSDKVRANLESNGLNAALPIQSTVIPLLLPGTSHYGDVCVQAATGSGKTLSYVVPIVESLLKDRGTGLRAVIVVPTQDLVKQVAKTCRMCVSGTSLNVLTAAGNKSLEREENSLVELQQVYDPEAYQKQQKTPTDWTTFSLERVLKRAHKIDPNKDDGYVVKMRIKADILVSTPGRLVDHLEKSDGFHLNDVKWLVVDEADRLLNQSYQDWVDVVMHALKSRKNFEEMDRILTYMRLKPPPRIVRKVLLSASMTKDISKLSRLELDDPKLVVLDSTVSESNPDTDLQMEETRDNQDEEYQLPSTLEEYAVGLKDGNVKPLLLLQLLETQIGISTYNKSDKFEGETSTSSSESETDSNEESSDSEETSSDESNSSESDVEMDSSADESVISSSVSDVQTRRKQLKASTRSTSGSISSTNPRALIFTRSADAATRLSRLLSLISPSWKPLIATLTRSTASSVSRKALSAFRAGQRPILITTDRASRGIDVPGLGNVINYDIPGSTLVYIHRVGRTARAGNIGKAWTLVEHREGRWFWNEIGGKSDECKINRRTKIKKLNIIVEQNDELSKKYEDALKTLGKETRGE